MLSAFGSTGCTGSPFQSNLRGVSRGVSKGSSHTRRLFTTQGTDIENPEVVWISNGLPGSTEGQETPSNPANNVPFYQE